MSDAPAVSRDAALAALARIVDPASGKDIVAAGMIGDLAIDGSKVRLVLEVPPERGPTATPIAQAAEQALKSMPGVTAASAIVTAHAASAPAAAAPPSLGAPRAPHTPPPGMSPLKKPAQNQGPIEGVDHIIAVGAGKGGVGKSTVAANLAVSLARLGRRVGLLDADVYGPSQPRMLGVKGRPSSPDGERIVPLRGHDVTLMSIGFMTEEDKAIIWRGPMLMGALQQMLRQVEWGRLDALIVDLPPGTGDVQLSLAQKTDVTGAIIVSTPQDIALLDARKAVDMFQRTNTPILGVIENMASFCCPNCGHETAIFGTGGAKAEAERIGAPFLGAIPLELDTRLSGDSGAPISVSQPDSPQAERFLAIAQGLVDQGKA